MTTDPLIPCCGRPVPDDKPPPIILGVTGIEPTKQEPSTPRDWRRIQALPPFQMFAAERGGHDLARVDEWMPGFMRSMALSNDPDALFAEYSAWHEAKGLWPNETPLGEAREG